MENITVLPAIFYNNSPSYGSGSGYGYGYGDGDGSGYGYGYGDGSGYGYGYGDGDGSGNSNGYGDGDGSGNGNGYGDGDGYGSGDGDGYIKSINGTSITLIDSVQTVIHSTKERGGYTIIRGEILREDMTFTNCYVASNNRFFAHAETIKEALQSLLDKINSSLPIEERIKKFLSTFNFTDKYPAKEFFSWHHTLTGSCLFGREAFCSDKGINLNKDKFTVNEFIALTENRYGGEIIKKLKDYEK
jgi:hypothetical protein